MNQDPVIAFLSAPTAYGADVTEVARVETHGAIVFLAGDRAYKLKRAVKYPYMDFSTPERRRAMCEAELRVNRRTAPQLYLEIRSIVRNSSGALSFGTRSEEQALDWVVVMKRFDQSNLLEEMRKRGALTPALMTELADDIAEFHRAAEVSREAGGSRGILSVIEQNIALLRNYEGRPFTHAAIERYRARSLEAYERVAALLAQRREQGFVRRCHGDLHLNNICLIDGKPVLFDAIEFSEPFSNIDVLYDLAFLVMDLEHHDLRPLANVLVNRYLAKTADYRGLAALPLFLSCRAAIRAHVTATLAAKSRDPAHELLSAASGLLDDATALLATPPPDLVAVGGLSGTGKSTLARGLAARIGAAPGAIVLRSDTLRKSLAGVGETTRLPDSSYSAAVNTRVYDEIARLAKEVLATGHSVIADAVFGTEAERTQIEAVARTSGAGFHGLWLAAPQAVLEGRIAQRHGDASDATVEILRHQLRTIPRPPDWKAVDASGTIKETLAKAMDRAGLQAKPNSQ